MTKEINLEDFFKIIKSGWKVLVITPIITAALMGLYSTYSNVPVYEATAKLLVQKQTNMQFNPVHIIGTYLEIAQSDITLDKVKAETDYKEGRDNLKLKPQGEMIFFTGTSTEPEQAAKIANSATKNLIEESKQIQGMDTLKVFQSAKTPTEPQEAGKARGYIGGGILGFILAFGIVTLRGFFKGTV